MIIVYFFYRADNKWKKGQKVFYSTDSASRFCWSMKNRKMILDGWSCYDPEDNVYLQRVVNISKINGWSY